MIGAEILDSVGADINKSYQNVMILATFSFIVRFAYAMLFYRRIGMLFSSHVA
jgi:hypothetical protein